MVEAVKIVHVGPLPQPLFDPVLSQLTGIIPQGFVEFVLARRRAGQIQLTAQLVLRFEQRDIVAQPRKIISSPTWSGIESEKATKQKMKRRKHALHAIHEGLRHFDVPVVLDDYALIGQIDEIIETDKGCYIVDYKDTDQDYGYWKIQLYAYQVGIEAQGQQVLGCYIYTIPNQSYRLVKMTQREAKTLKTITQALQQMIDTESCPAPTAHEQKCHTCQYARFCNDVT